MNNLISVIIPVHNRPTLCQEAFESVMAQGWDRIEVIFVDDGSTDDTSRVLERMHQKHPAIVHVLTQRNAGPGVARQHGLSISRGEYVQFLDSDDILLPGKFRAQVAALRQNLQAGIAYGHTWIRHPDGTGEPSSKLPACEMPTQLFPWLLSARLWETSAPLYRRTALERIGDWPRKRQMEDWEFDAQAGAANIVLAPCEGFMAEYRMHGGPRLAHAWVTDAAAMADRLSAYGAIFAHARTAGVTDDAAQMQRFARTLFAMARQAGQRGFAADGRKLLELACSIRSPRNRDMHLYALAVKCLGWKLAGRLAGHLAGASWRHGKGKHA